MAVPVSHPAGPVEQPPHRAGGRAVEVEQVQAPARDEHPVHLAQRRVLLVLRQVVEHERRQDPVDAAVGVGEPVGVPLVEPELHAGPPRLPGGDRERGASGSRPVNVAPGTARAASSSTFPVPHPISRTVAPGSMPAWATSCHWASRAPISLLNGSYHRSSPGRAIAGR